MPHHSESIEIARPADAVWAVLAEPERWFAGYRSTRQRSPAYPGAQTSNDYVFHTRVDEDVTARVDRSEHPTLLEEEHEGRSFRRRIRYLIEAADGTTRLTVEDEVQFKGLARLAGPIAFDDVKRRWKRSLEQLRSAVESRH